MPVFVAHQGGWDEILYLAVPAVAVILWVRWAERRARGRAEGSAADPATILPDDSDPT